MTVHINLTRQKAFLIMTHKNSFKILQFNSLSIAQNYSILNKESRLSNMYTQIFYNILQKIYCFNLTSKHKKLYHNGN